MDSYHRNYIGDAWVDGGAGRIDVTDPATGARLERGGGGLVQADMQDEAHGSGGIV
jgi:hypothetical protein